MPLAKGNGPLDNPFLTVFEPPPAKRNGSSVIVAPGGSNIMLMYGAEGIDIAEQYNEWGVTAFVLTYRMSPAYNTEARSLDGKRAVQVVRAHAAEMKLDPEKIGFIGFSAGGGSDAAVHGDGGSWRSERYRSGRAAKLQTELSGIRIWRSPGVEGRRART